MSEHISVEQLHVEVLLGKRAELLLQYNASLMQLKQENERLKKENQAGSEHEKQDSQGDCLDCEML